MLGHPNDPKATNPKDAIAGSKLPIDLVPDTAIAFMALAFLEGATKYGRYNWRIAGVRWSVYESALQRHRMKLHNGEWADPVTGVPHAASMMACLAILLDAKIQGKLIDDRPPRVPGFSSFIDGLVDNVAQIKKVFEKHNPHQYTINDGVDEDGKWPGEQPDQSGGQDSPPKDSPREDAQSISGRDSGRVVFRFPYGFVGGVEVAGLDAEGQARAISGAGPIYAPDRVVKGSGSGGTER